MGVVCAAMLDAGTEAAGLPQDKQNAAVIGSAVPQWEHVIVRLEPQLIQNRACGGFSCWQLRHVTVAVLSLAEIGENPMGQVRVVPDALTHGPLDEGTDRRYEPDDLCSNE